MPQQERRVNSTQQQFKHNKTNCVHLNPPHSFSVNVFGLGSIQVSIETICRCQCEDTPVSELNAINYHVVVMTS